MISLRPFDRSGNFLVAPGEVSRLAIRGAGATLLSAGSGLIIQMGSTLILARLLLPSDFGVVTMVTTFSLLLLNFGVNGVTEAILQAGEMTHQVASNVFWFNTASGLVLTLAFASAGSYLGRFYSDARIAPVAVGVSLSVLLTSTSAVPLALLNRAMRFSYVSANDVIARTLTSILTVILAWAGWGYWALVAGVVALPLCTTVGAWWMCWWVPSRPRRAEGTTSIISFALHTYGRFSLNYFTRNIDNLLVGWRFGAVSLGFYKKAYDLFATPVAQSVGPITNVALTGLSRFKKEPAQYQRHLLSAISVMAFLGMGLGALLTLVGKDLIRILLGAKWGPAGDIFVYFGPGIGIMLLYYSHSWIHYSIGRADRALRWGIIEVVVVVFMFLVGLHWGPKGIAGAWTLSTWLLTLPAFWYAGRPMGLGFAPILKAVWKYVVASLTAGSATALVSMRILTAADDRCGACAFSHFVVTSLMFAALYLGAVILLHRGCDPLVRFAALVRQMLPLGPVSRPPEESFSREAEIAVGVTPEP